MTNEMEMASFMDQSSEKAFQLAMEDPEFKAAMEVEEIAEIADYEAELVEISAELSFPSSSLVPSDDVDEWDEDFVADMEAEVTGWDNV